MFQFIKTWQTQLTFRRSSEGNQGHVLIVFIESWHKHVCFWCVLSVTHCGSYFPPLYIITHVFIVVLHNPDESSTGQSPPGLLIHQPSHSSVSGSHLPSVPVQPVINFICPSTTSVWNPCPSRTSAATITEGAFDLNTAALRAMMPD